MRLPSSVLKDSLTAWVIVNSFTSFIVSSRTSAKPLILQPSISNRLCTLDETVKQIIFFYKRKSFRIPKK